MAKGFLTRCRLSSFAWDGTEECVFFESLRFHVGDKIRVWFHVIQGQISLHQFAEGFGLELETN